MADETGNDEWAEHDFEAANEIVAAARERLRVERDGWQATAAGISQDLSNAEDEIERLRAVVDAVEDLHSPRLAHDTCLACGHDWPCPTHQLIHPEETRHE